MEELHLQIPNFCHYPKVLILVFLTSQVENSFKIITFPFILAHILIGILLVA